MVSNSVDFKHDTSLNPSTDCTSNASAVRYDKSCQTKTEQPNQSESDLNGPFDRHDETRKTLKSCNPVLDSASPFEARIEKGTN